MNITVLFFGISSDLVNKSSIIMEIKENTSIKDLKDLLQFKFPLLKELSSYAVAINECYADNDDVVLENDIVAIIPPVSGG